MIKDEILFKGSRFQLSTINENGLFETMVFPIEYGVVSGSEVYCFRTVEQSKSMKKHEDILYHPEKYLTPSAIKEYLDSKEDDFKITDLQKFKNFFEGMDIRYEAREVPNGEISLNISRVVSGRLVDGSITFYFNKNNGYELSDIIAEN